MNKQLPDKQTILNRFTEALSKGDFCGYAFFVIRENDVGQKYCSMSMEGIKKDLNAALVDALKDIITDGVENKGIKQ